MVTLESRNFWPACGPVWGRCSIPPQPSRLAKARHTLVLLLCRSSVHRLAKPGVISVAQRDCMFPEWFGPGSTFATDARTVDRHSFRAVSSLRACRDVEKARLERAFSLRLGRRANGQLPTGWK